LLGLNRFELECFISLCENPESEFVLTLFVVEGLKETSLLVGVKEVIVVGDLPFRVVSKEGFD